MQSHEREFANFLKHVFRSEDEKYGDNNEKAIVFVKLFEKISFNTKRNFFTN